MMDKIVQALTTAYKRDHEGVENVIVDVDEAKRDLKMYVQKEVVEEVENPGTQMSLEDAKKLSAKYEVGSIVNLPVDNVEFGRIAAGNGKQVIIQGLREAESGMVYEEYNSKQHEILTGVVTRIDPRNGSVALRIGTGAEATDAILTAGEQVKGETLVEGDERFAETAEKLAVKARRAAERRREAEAHERNVRTGKKRPAKKTAEAGEAEPKRTEKRPALRTAAGAGGKRPTGAQSRGDAKKPSREEHKRSAVKAAARARYADSRPVKRGKGSAKKEKQ